MIARVMGPAAMGLWLLLTLLPTYAEGFGRLKADVAAVYLLGGKRWHLGEMCTAINLIALATGGLIAAVLAVLEAPVLAWLFPGGEVDVVTYRVILLSIPVHFLAMNYAYLLLHFQDVRAYNIQSFLRTVLPSVAAALLVLLTPWRVEALAWSLLAGGVLGLVLAAGVVHRHGAPRWPRRPGLYRALLGYGSGLYFAGMIENVNQYLSSLLVGLHLAPKELSFFRLGQDRLQLLDQIPSSVNTILFPRLASIEDAAARRDLVARSCRVLLLLLAVTGVAGAVLAPAMVWVLYGRDFLPMVWTIWLLLPGVAALGFTSPAVQYFMSCGRPDLVWKMALLPLAVQLGSLFPLLGLWGYKGAALAVSASFVLHAALRIGLLARDMGRPVSALIAPTRSDVQLVAGFIAERTGMRRFARAVRGLTKRS